MGFGDAFRMVAQGLLGAGGTATQYALDRDTELRKQKLLMQLYSQKQEAITPLQQEKMRAEINALNRRNNGSGKSDETDNRIEEMILLEEQARGTPFTPEQRATARSRLLQRMILKPSGTPLLESEDILNPFADLLIPEPPPPPPPPQQSFFDKYFRKNQPVVTPPNGDQSQPMATSLPPRKPGETQEQYSQRTGIQFK